MQSDVERRLELVLRWLGTAKENLPAINDGAVPADQIAEASRLVDQLHRAAVALQARVSDRRRQHRAA